MTGADPLGAGRHDGPVEGFGDAPGAAFGGALGEADRAAAIEQLARSRTGAGIEGDLGADERASHRRSPVCGDEVTVRVRVVDGAVAALRWDGHGCMVSTASAGALAALLPGLPVAHALALIDRHTAAVEPDGAADDALGDAAVFAGIGRYPLRAGCATLAWRAAAEALAGAAG